MQTLFELLEQSAQSYGDKTFTQIREQDHWRALSFRKLCRTAEAFGAGLRKRGCAPGDRVALLTENRPEWGIVFFGILRAGGIAVPLDKLLQKDELESILRMVRPKFIAASRDYLSLASGIRGSAQLVALDGEVSGAPTVDEIIGEGSGGGALQPPVENAGSTAVVIFTSGTTGTPQGILLSHRNFISNVRAFTRIFPRNFFRKNFMSVLPLNHAYEITGGFLTPLSGGGTVTYADSFKPQRLLELMRDTKSEIMLAVPALLEMLQNAVLRQIRQSPKTASLFKIAAAAAPGLPVFFRRQMFRGIHAAFGGSLRYFVSGGAPLAAEVQDFFERLGFEVLQGYGLTETAPVLSVNPLHHARKGSVGKPVAGVALKIDAETGEILARGPNIMKGYYEDAEAAKRVFRGGFFCTGDLGRLDKDGYLYITGRLKNLIVTSGGKNISPEELEEKLKHIPYVKEICVLGRKKGIEERVTAVVAPDREKLTADGIPETEVRRKILEGIKAVNASMADFKRVTELVLWEGEFPKTTTLKVKRSRLLDDLKVFQEGRDVGGGPAG